MVAELKNFYIDTPSRSIVDVTEAFDKESSYYISRIHVPPGRDRGKGIASNLLKQVIADADNEQVDLYLWISPSDGLNFDQLEAWYSRYGFTWSGLPRESLMVRRFDPNK